MTERKTFYLVMRTTPWTSMQAENFPYSVGFKGVGFGFCPVFETREEAEIYLNGNQSKIYEVAMYRTEEETQE